MPDDRGGRYDDSAVRSAAHFDARGDAHAGAEATAVHQVEISLARISWIDLRRIGDKAGRM